MPTAYPFVDIEIDKSGLTPRVQPSSGVIAIVGTTPDGASGGTAAVNVPYVVTTPDEVRALFGQDSVLQKALLLALTQDRVPQKVYGVRVKGTEHAAGLAALEAVDDVSVVCLAGVTDAGTETPPAGLLALRAHVEEISAKGLRRIGVAMIDPKAEKAPDYVAKVLTPALLKLRSDSGRMVLVAARGADGDVAAATAAVIAAHPPHASLLLKQVKGVRIPKEKQYGPSEIIELSRAGLNPVIDPALIAGEGLHLAEGQTFTTDPAYGYIDLRRVVDHVEFLLRAGLIGGVGDARITRTGLTMLKQRTEGILGGLLRASVIAGFEVRIPVLEVLGRPETEWTQADQDTVRAAREQRAVDVQTSITYGPAVHRLHVKLAVTY
ncbi:hypothetical protein ABT093_34535 [Kitasatospora sp. NPDC002551]|uniref:hypothetical protein n=1 Tax=Kitasatospora sp. NPDC002551 TaxID=3154539 RepID=UPI003316B25E